MVDSVKRFNQVQKYRTSNKALVHVVQYCIQKMSKCDPSWHLRAKSILFRCKDAMVAQVFVDLEMKTSLKDFAYCWENRNQPVIIGITSLEF